MSRPGHRGTPRGMVGLVVRREITTRVRERSFIISTVVTLLIIAAVIIVPTLLSRGGDEVHGRPGRQRRPPSSPRCSRRPPVQDVKLTVQRYADEAAARTAVQAGDVDAVFLGGDRVLVKEDLDGETEQVVQTAYRQAAAAQRLAAAGIDPAAAARALDVPPLAVTAIDPPDPDSDARRSRGVLRRAAALLPALRVRPVGRARRGRGEVQPGGRAAARRRCGRGSCWPAR